MGLDFWCLSISELMVLKIGLRPLEEITAKQNSLLLPLFSLPAACCSDTLSKLFNNLSSKKMQQPL